MPTAADLALFVGAHAFEHQPTAIDLDHVNRLGWTALLEAIILGDGGARHTEVVRLLVAAGADVDIADANGVSPLAHARRRGFAEIAAILERGGAK